MNMRTPPSLLDDDNDDSHPNISQDVDFSEYMWMEQMEEFDRQVEAELQEEELMEQCFEDLYEMEQLASEILSSSPINNALITFESQAGPQGNGLVMARQELRPPAPVTIIAQEEVSANSKLNPLAPEFQPRGPSSGR